jgi:MscS family membrane protein
MKSNIRPTFGITQRACRLGFPRAGAVVLIVACFASQARSAQKDGDFLSAADTSSPQATLKTFIDACNDFYQLTKADRHFDRRSPYHRPRVRRVLDCLDTSELPDYAREEIAAEAAVCLKEILDRRPLSLEEAPDVKAIKAPGGPEKPFRWNIPDTRLTIARVEEGPHKHEYLFTPGTVERAAEYYEEIEHRDYRTTGPEVSRGFYRWYSTAPGHPLIARIVDWLPEWTRERTFGLAIWQWAGLLLASLITIVSMALAYRIQRSLAIRWREGRTLRYGVTILLSVAAALFPLLFKHIVEQDLTVRGTPLYVASFCANLVALLGAIVVVFGATNRVAAIIIASPRINPKGLNAQLIRIACKLTSIVTAVIIFLEGGRYLGIPVATLLASAGIGGLAVALAAQDTLKTLFGTIMLLADKPFRVGERIIFGKYDGVVEDIGLRSTRIRLLTGHQANIPNDELTRTDIENVGRRPHIRRTATIEMPSGTPVRKVKRALEIIRTAIDNHEGMENDFPPRVFLRDLNESSIGIFMIYWYHPATYWDFLAFSEKVNLQILEQLEAEEIPFAAPALTVYTPDGRRPRLNVGITKKDADPEGAPKRND